MKSRFQQWSCWARWGTAFRKGSPDEFAELGDRLSAAHEVAIDDETGRPQDTNSRARLRVIFDLACMGMGRQCRFEGGFVQADFLCVLDQSGLLQPIRTPLVLEQPVVHAPKPVLPLLFERLQGRLG